MGHAGMAAAAVRYLRSAGEPRTAGPVDPLPRPDLRAVGDDERAPIDPAEFRRVLGNFATGVTVITAPAPATTPDSAPGTPSGTPSGFACQSFAALSLDPPLIAFMVARTSTTWPRIARAGVFCVNVLGAHQGDLCRRFAVSGSDKFAGVDHEPSPVSGSPRLAGATAWIDCAVHAVHTGGDHLIVVGRVNALGTPDPDPDGNGGAPLLFHRGRFGDFTA
ncbi:flavin reductase family protein [Streptomyces sp. NPDC057621]|uniref:Flavin reductase family protein n=1 Tax=Streptomyces liliiviolaceus TaxID=2823109 RepID=A0A940XJS8_9ACTN|nr:flavin reductase family protein [Streptomyces liliiviolaceus]MBQ0847324.1 flavin reductase family protein [Streptomyces liliiviolaceus]